MSEPIEETCGTCRFWRRMTDTPEPSAERALEIVRKVTPGMDDFDAQESAQEFINTIKQGECRRFPPQYVVWGGQTGDSRFPVMQPEEWCGEYATRLDSPK